MKCNHTSLKVDRNGLICVDCGYRYPEGTRLRLSRDTAYDGRYGKKPGKEYTDYYQPSGEEAYYNAGGGWCTY